MDNRKTVGEVMEEMRLKAGAKEYGGHSYMDLMRFDENTRHMVIFDVLTHDSPVGFKGERMHLYLSDTGYEKAKENRDNGNIKILSHAKVSQGIFTMTKRNRCGKYKSNFEGREENCRKKSKIGR